MVGALPVDPGPQLGQGLGREFGVFGGQGVGEDALPRGQGRGHQGPVGVALGAGQGESGVDWRMQGLISSWNFIIKENLFKPHKSYVGCGSRTRGM